MHCEGIMAGELKHGPLALVDDLMPIVMIVMRDCVYNKTINAIMQVKARGGQPIVICESGDKETEQYASKILEVPKTVDCLQVSSTIKSPKGSLIHQIILSRESSPSFQCSFCHITSPCCAAATSIAQEISLNRSPLNKQAPSSRSDVKYSSVLAESC